MQRQEQLLLSGKSISCSGTCCCKGQDGTTPCLGFAPGNTGIQVALDTGRKPSWDFPAGPREWHLLHPGTGRAWLCWLPDRAALSALQRALQGAGTSPVAQTARSRLEKWDPWDGLGPALIAHLPRGASPATPALRALTGLSSARASGATRGRGRSQGL